MGCCASDSSWKYELDGNSMADCSAATHLFPHQHHHHRHGTSDRTHISYGTVEVLLPSDDDQHQHQQQRKWWSLARVSQYSLICLRHMLFHVVNALVAALACLLLLAALGCALVLLPLCCVGVLVFRMLFDMGVVELLARSDVELVNFVSPAKEQILLESAESKSCDPLHPLLRGNHSHRLASGLTNVSSAPLLVVLYFVTIKCVLGMMGLFVVGLVLWVPLVLLRSLLAFAGGARVMSSSILSGTAWDVVCELLVLVLVFAVAVGSLEPLSNLSCATTRFFCCERVRTPASSVTPIIPGEPPAPASEVCPRSNVVVVHFARPSPSASSPLQPKPPPEPTTINLNKDLAPFYA